MHQAGRKYGYIVTSAFLPILDDILATGIDVLIGLDPEEGKGTDLAAVKQKLPPGGGEAIWGGVSGAVTVERGTEEETAAAVRRALEVAGQRAAGSSSRRWTTCARTPRTPGATPACCSRPGKSIEP